MSDPLTIIHGDALASLRRLPDESVQCCVTSPPYFGLRDYGVENQIGLERTPDEYVARLVEIFSELKRVLRADGTLWLNLGDSYAGSGKGGNPEEGKQASNRGSQTVGVLYGTGRTAREAAVTNITRKTFDGIKAKDLIGIPWMVAFALRADGWYLRSDIIWSKPNPMPESVTDRPTRSHEYVFLLTKDRRYYYNADAIAEPLDRPEELDRATPAKFGGANKWHEAQKQSRLHSRNEYKRKQPEAYRGSSFTDGKTAALKPNVGNGERREIETRNKRSVWRIATTPYPDAHFATFPTELPRLCILAGSRPAGKRCDCDEIIDTPLGASDGAQDPTMEIGRAGFNRPRKDDEGVRPITRREQRAYAEQMKVSPHRAEMATEASTSFEHYIRTDKSGARPLPSALLDEWLSRGWLTAPEPCACPIGDADIVIDPFAGSGTTGKVAVELGRRAILIEPKTEYVELIRRRCQTQIGLALELLRVSQDVF